MKRTIQFLANLVIGSTLIYATNIMADECNGSNGPKTCVFNNENAICVYGANCYGLNSNMNCSSDTTTTVCRAIGGSSQCGSGAACQNYPNFSFSQCRTSITTGTTAMVSFQCPRMLLVYNTQQKSFSQDELNVLKAMLPSNITKCLLTKPSKLTCGDIIFDMDYQ